MWKPLIVKKMPALGTKWRQQLKKLLKNYLKNNGKNSLPTHSSYFVPSRHSFGGNWSEVPGLSGGVGRHGDCYILGQNKMGNLTTALPELMLPSNVELALPPKGSIS